MENNRAEQERKELNKKLLKKTFVSEMKSRKQVTVKYVIDFIAIFVGLLLSNQVIKWLSVDFWFFRLIISVVIILVMQFLGSLLTKRNK